MPARWRSLAAAAAASWLAVLPAHALAQLTNVDSATDICPANVDPCVITQSVQVVDGAVLDFGRRGVEIRGVGVLDVGTRSATLRCGSFFANVGEAAAVLARGGSGTGTIDGGSFTLEALRACSADPNVRCIGDADCGFGECTLAGTCAGDATRSCGQDADCNLGSCVVGSGNVQMNGAVRADGREGGTIAIRAAGDIVTHRILDADSTGSSSDGGSVDLFARGSVTVNGRIEAKGGGFGQGGSVSVVAAASLSVRNAVDVSGGDFDGGLVGLEAAGDLLLEGDVLADATNGEGSGGEIALSAGGDLTIGALRTLSADGSAARDMPGGGDGGTIEANAGNDLVVGAGTVLRGDGAEPDGSGDAITLQAGRNMTMHALLSSRSRGTEGAGGSVELSAAADLVVSSGARIDVRGGASNGGDVLLSSSGPMTFAGTIAAEGSNGGTGDSVRLQSLGDLEVSGNVTQGGQTSAASIDGSIDLSGCAVTLAGGASLVNAGARGVNTVAARNAVVVEAGAALIASKPLGKNRFVLADDADAPVLEGTVDPAAVVEIDNELIECAECGNAKLDPGETCDDGNETPGDGCSAECQNEDCIEATIGWPDAPLCNDDRECTADFCDVLTSSCVNRVACDDEFVCTVDQCAEDGSCKHVPDSSFCDDVNACTTDVCFGSTGCVFFPEDKPCDDGLGCTDADTCIEGFCRGAKNCPDAHFCSNVTGECVAGSTTTTTTVSTTTTTLAPSVCGNGEVEATEDCDDGDVSWQIGQPCNAQCAALACGDADDTGDTKASDSLIALRSAVGGLPCDVCLCDVDASGAVTATDALALLRAAVGLASALDCPDCFEELD